MKQEVTQTDCQGLHPIVQPQVSFRQISVSYLVIKIAVWIPSTKGLDARSKRERTAGALRTVTSSWGRSTAFFTFSAPGFSQSFGKNMKTTHLLAALVTATLPLTALAEDTAKTETTDQNQTQSAIEMKGMDMGQMMSNSIDQDAELDKLVAAMNSASADKKFDAIAAVVTKLVEQRKAIHEQIKQMMSANDKEGMSMCRMMGCDHDGKHSPNH